MTLLLTIAGLYAVVLLRAGGTYVLGRLAVRGARRLRLRRRVGSDRIAKVERLVDRWGPLTVIGSFFTIGAQTAVNFVAGLLRMPLIGYLPSLAAGGLAWAVIYGTLGALTIDGIITLSRTHPLLVTVVLIGLSVSVAALIIRALRRRVQTRRSSNPQGSDTPHKHAAHLPSEICRSARSNGWDPV